MNYKDQSIIESIIEDSAFSMDFIDDIQQYNAKQYEVKMYNDIKETTYYLDFNLTEMWFCEINPTTRKRLNYQDFKI